MRPQYTGRLDWAGPSIHSKSGFVPQGKTVLQELRESGKESSIYTLGLESRNHGKQNNTKYYCLCNRNILNSFTSRLRQMSFPGPKWAATYHNGKLPLLDYDTPTKNQYITLVETNAMTELSTAQHMIKAAYMKYLDTEVDSVDSYSTMDKYTDQLTEHFQNPETTEEPPYCQDALREIREYTS